MSGRGIWFQRMRNLFEVVKAQAEGKALPNHPAFSSDARTTTYSPGGDNPTSEAAISQKGASKYVQTYGGDHAIDWVMSCVDFYADTVATADFHLEREKEWVYLDRGPGVPDDAEIVDPMLRMLLTQPNPYMDWDELIHLLIVDWLLTGNAYWMKYGELQGNKPTALYRLAPSDIQIVPDAWGPASYVYQPAGAEEPLKLSPEKVVHFRRPNPHSKYYGVGVIQGGGRPVDLELALTDTQASFYENKADPSLVVQSERRIPRDVMNKLRGEMRARHSGPSRAGELLVLEAGLKAETLSNSAKDALFDILTRLSRDRIFSLFKVSPLLLGIVDESGLSNKPADAQRIFDNKVMAPLLRKLQKKITSSLLQPWGLEMVYDYHYVIPEEELVKLGGEMAAVPGIKVKELRKFFFEGGIIDEISTGDEKVDEFILNMPGEQLDANGQNGLADRPLPGEAGRPPLGENTAGFPRNVNVAVPGQKADVDDPLEERRDQEIDAIASDLEAQILDAVHVFERQMLDHSEGKSLGDLIRRVKNSNAWPRFRNMLSDAFGDAATQAFNAATLHQFEQYQIRPEDELDYDDLIREMINRPEGVGGIADNLKAEMLKKLEQAPDDATKEDVDRIVRDITQKWRDRHAETVALSEAVSYYNRGTVEVAERSGHSQVAVFDGHDYDQPCIEADGQVWSVEHAKKNLLEHPRCRRGFAPYAA